MNSQITLSKALPDDARGITIVRRNTWLETYPNEKEGITKEDIEESFKKSTIEEESVQRADRIRNNADTQIWVAKDTNSIIGFAEAQKNKDKNAIKAFYILPAYQEQGIGTELMKNILQWFTDKKSISCGVASYNTQAIAFYEKFGFVKKGFIYNKSADLLKIPVIGMEKPIV